VKRLLPLSLCLLVSAPAFAAPKAKPAPVVVAPAPAAPPVDPEAWRATAPLPAVARAWAPPTATQFTLSNGIPVTFVQNDALPLVSVRLVMSVGREANPAGKAGLGALTANLLDEGTTTRTGAQLAAEATGLGADLGVGAGDELAWVSVDALARNLSPSLDLLADVTRNPRFEKAEVARVRNETLASIQAARAEPRDGASRAFAAQLFGKSHPYGTPSVGTAESVERLRLKDVRDFHAQWWHAGNAGFVVTGNVSEGALKDLLEARFGVWKARPAARTPVAPATAPLKTRVVFVDQPGAVQSVLRIGGISPARNDAGFMAANVAGTLVGGMFSSRINMNLREEHGWSYGAFAGFAESRDAGTFSVRTQVQADKTAPAVVEILKELAAAAAKAPTPEEMSLTQDYLLKSLPGNFDTNATTAGSFLAIPQFGMGPDLWAKYVTEVKTVDAPTAQAAAQKWFAPEHLIIVVAGPRTVEVDDGKGGKQVVDVVKELRALSGKDGAAFEFVEG
jgi:zinc protease